MDGLNEKKENSAGIQSLMEFIDEDANPPVQQKPYWLCMQCMNSYSSRHYLLKKHRCTKSADGRRQRRKDGPPQQPYALKSRCDTDRKKAECCQVNTLMWNGKSWETRSSDIHYKLNLGRDLSNLLERGAIKDDALNSCQIECIQMYKALFVNVES